MISTPFPQPPLMFHHIHPHLPHLPPHPCLPNYLTTRYHAHPYLPYITLGHLLLITPLKPTSTHPPLLTALIITPTPLLHSHTQSPTLAGQDNLLLLPPLLNNLLPTHCSLPHLLLHLPRTPLLPPIFHHLPLPLPLPKGPTNQTPNTSTPTLSTPLLFILYLPLLNPPLTTKP